MDDSPTEPHRRILVVEDEAHLASGLKLNFEFEGYDVTVATTLREARTKLTEPGPFDLIVLDVMLPDGDGFSLARGIRKAGNFTPIIMLTARTLAEDRVKGLESGADDYMTKPFDLDELLARVQAVFRRRDWERAAQVEPPSGNTIRFGPVEVDFDTHRVTVAGESRELTKLELDLVQYFWLNAGRVISRAELLEKVWKLRNYPNTRTVDNFVLRLRRHFEVDPSKPDMFLSVRGAGYKFEVP